MLYRGRRSHIVHIAYCDSLEHLGSIGFKAILLLMFQVLENVSIIATLRNSCISTLLPAL